MDKLLGAAPHLSEPTGPEAVEYRPVSRLALLGLALGLASPTALIAPLLWIVCALGAMTNLLALGAIARSGSALSGRGLARAGLALSLIFGVAMPVANVGRDWWIRVHARPVAQAWFEFLRDGQPHKAHQLMYSLNARHSLDSEILWEYYRQNPGAKSDLEQLVAEPLVRTMLALGQRAEVRYYETESQIRDRFGDIVQLIYAITYDDDVGQRTTFFARITVRRTTDDSTGRAVWHVTEAVGGVRPPSL